MQGIEKDLMERNTLLDWGSLGRFCGGVLQGKFDHAQW